MTKYCPTQSGKFTAYKPQYRYNSEEGWKTIPVKDSRSVGIPYPKSFGGIINTIGLYGYSQAKALLWTWVAFCEAEGKEVEAQLEVYEVDYQIKALKIKRLQKLT